MSSIYSEFATSILAQIEGLAIEYYNSERIHKLSFEPINISIFKVFEIHNLMQTNGPLVREILEEILQKDGLNAVQNASHMELFYRRVKQSCQH